MVTLVPGKSRCTASAMTWAVEWRMTARPVGIGGADGRERVDADVDRRVQVDDAGADLDGDDVLVELAGGGEELARGGAFHGGRGV